MIIRAARENQNTGLLTLPPAMPPMFVWCEKWDKSLPDVISLMVPIYHSYLCSVSFLCFWWYKESLNEGSVKKKKKKELEHLFILRCITAQLRLEGASGVTLSNNPAYFCVYLLSGSSFDFLVLIVTLCVVVFSDMIFIID